jgi:hypothetical protein
MIARGSFLAAAVLGLSAFNPLESMARNDKAIKTANESEKPREIARATQELAAGVDPEDHKALLRLLRDPAFRDRLDPPDADVAGADDLYLAKPIQTLARNKSEFARATLRQLIQDPAFTDDDDRLDLLVGATETWRPAEPVVVAFWRRMMDPDGAQAELTVAAAAENASEPAVEFFGECLCDTRFEDEARVAWMRRQFLLHRTEESFLRLAERLTVGPDAGKLPKKLQLAFVEAIFDFEQEQWYPPHNPPVPPKRARTGRAGRDILRRIAAHARADLELDEGLRAAIAGVLKELDVLDKNRAP